MGNTVLIPKILSEDQPYGSYSYKSLPSVIPRYLKVEKSGMKILHGIYTRMDLLPEVPVPETSDEGSRSRHDYHLVMKNDTEIRVEEAWHKRTMFINPDTRVVIYLEHSCASKQNRWMVSHPENGIQFYYNNASNFPIPPTHNWKLLDEGRLPLPVIKHLL